MFESVLPSPLPLSPGLSRRIDEAARALMQPAEGALPDFSRPEGERALYPPGSVAWRVFKNPVSLFIGGAAAVILELAEPRVRTGVWEHSSFRSDPVRRLRRTGAAAMMSVYGPESAAEAQIARVVQLHRTIGGRTPAGLSYRASDPELLSWVYATAGYGFVEAYNRYVQPLSGDDIDRYYDESRPAARLYGATGAPRSRSELTALFGAMQDRLEASPIVLEFLRIMRHAPALPAPLRPVQRMLVRAAADLVPPQTRLRLGLGGRYGLRPWEGALVRQAGALSDRLLLQSSPAVQACLRLGLPADFLYRTRR